MRVSISEKMWKIVINSVFIMFSLAALIPFVLTLIVSFSSEKSVISKGYSFFPEGFSLDAYRYVFSSDVVFNAYGVSIFVTVVGTVLAVTLCSMCGFAISVPKVKHRNKIALFLYFPTVFSAGMVPWYILVTRYLGLKNSLLGLILPYLIGAFNIFLMRNYFKTIPSSLMESAEIDGANPFYMFFKIIFPLSAPILATIALFTSLGYWNDWYLALWLIDKKELYPLQYMLYRLYSLIQYMAQTGGQISGSQGIPSETIQVATMFVTIGPIILVYPFVQKFFIKGIMIGAVKG